MYWIIDRETYDSLASRKVITVGGFDVKRSFLFVLKFINEEKVGDQLYLVAKYTPGDSRRVCKHVAIDLYYVGNNLGYRLSYKFLVSGI
ncbi:MAG: hypothetical protein DRO67_00715 [Candidatus Asgardarchaeum californiense]|nr:MAG: hypothetical protein DRO67_00715 [Candidatus Asgardarchaeum californiense]